MEKKNIDNDIKELKQKINEIKKGREKTLHQFAKEYKLSTTTFSKSLTKLNFKIFRTLTLPKLNSKEKDTYSSIYNSISWGGESSMFSSYMASCTSKGNVYIYNIKTKSLIHEFNFNNFELNTVSLEPYENNLLAAGGFDGGIYVSNLNNSKHKDSNNESKDHKKFTGHQGVVSCCKFLNTFYLLSASYDSMILLWDINSQGKFIHSYHDHTSEVSGLDVNELNGNIFATGSGDTTAKLWDIREKKACVCTFKGSETIVSCVKFLPGRYTTLAAGSEDSIVRLYDLRALKELAAFKKSSNDNNSINSIAFSKSGQILYASSSNSSKIHFWNIFGESSEPFYSYEHKGDTKGIKQIAMDSTGANIAYLLDDQINILQ